MKNKKRILCIIIVSLVLLFGIYIFYESYIPYEEIPFEYAGSASGKLNIINSGQPEKWAEKEYVYNSYEGYFIVNKKTWDFCARACELNNFDFELQFEDNQFYVCTYGYRLKTLEYSTRKRTRGNGYYNRATLWTDDYREGIFYFYQIGEIGQNLGNMQEELHGCKH